MAETLGSLCDKLTIVKLKQWHSEDPESQKSLGQQQVQLETEINEFLAGALDGSIPSERLTFAANKVYNQAKNPLPVMDGNLPQLFSHLAEVNCQLWHEVDKGYEIEKVPPAERDNLIKQLAGLNLQRTQCIDLIDRHFAELIGQARKPA